MGRGENPEDVTKSISAGQLVMLFLAGTAICGVFFSAGFWLGHNERETPLTPVTEHVSQPSDIPPVAAQNSPGAADDPGASASKDETMAPNDAQPAPMRPQPLSSSTDAGAKPAINSRESSAVAAPAEPADSNSTARAGIPSATALREPAVGGSSFLIQVAATSTQPDAVKMVKALKALGYTVIFVTPEQAHAGDNLFRVQVGPFATRESAEKVKAKLIQDGFKQPFIKH